MGAKISNFCNLSLRNRRKWPPTPHLDTQQRSRKVLFTRMVRCLQVQVDPPSLPQLHICGHVFCTGSKQSWCFPLPPLPLFPLFPLLPPFLLPPFPSQCFPPSPSPAAHKSLSLWLAHPHQQQESSLNKFEFKFYCHGF